uniref:SCP domain-containing protein n=1 Tax=Paramormyrops kingsleyae TaxID=1676925 RepID=A0A3B3QB99_9TELE
MAFHISVTKMRKNMADTDFEREFLEAHNAYRQDHGAPPLTLSRELSVSAQSWADHLLAIRMLKHSPQSDKGENIFCMQSSRPMKISGKQPVENWYNEIKDYNFSRPGFTPNTGHFTQVVWKDTKELGVGIATDGTTIFVVGQYVPPGNMNVQSYFERNVLPPGSSAKGGGGGSWLIFTQRNNQRWIVQVQKVKIQAKILFQPTS